MKEKSFYRSSLAIALPVALQSLLQSSFSVADQIMIGSLGSTSITGIGLGGRFASMYSVVLGAVAAAAGIMMAQYLGQKDQGRLRRCFFANLRLASVLALLWMGVCLLFPEQIMGLYTQDAAARDQAAAYLRLYCLTFLPMAVTTIASVLLRCVQAASLPLAASFFSVLLNTGLNYLLIFGKAGFPALGLEGAAVASVAAQVAACLITLLFCRGRLPWDRKSGGTSGASDRGVFVRILAPILVCEFFWSLGENVYGAIYGHIGTDPCAAMTMTGALQGLTIGLLSGLSQAAAILIGNFLGSGQEEEAYAGAKKLVWMSLAGSLVLSAALAALGPCYVRIYRVGPEVQATCYRILLVFALYLPVKVLNMVLGGGIIRSGGKTDYVMWIDLIGTWIFGVPLGLLAAFVWKLPIAQVYAILSIEEVLRLGMAIFVFRSRRWMRRI